MEFPLTADEKLFFGQLFAQASKGSGLVKAADAVVLLQKSKLPQTVLHKIWALSDRKTTGVLDESGFYMSLKLVALAQAGVNPLTDQSVLQNTSTPLPNLLELTTAFMERWLITPAKKD